MKATTHPSHPPHAVHLTDMGLIDIAATKAANEWLFCAAPSCCSSGGCASTIRSTAHNNGIIIGIQLGEQDANEYCCISLRCCLGAKYTPSGVDQLPLFPTSLSGPADDLLCQVSTPCVQAHRLINYWPAT